MLACLAALTPGVRHGVILVRLLLHPARTVVTAAERAEAQARLPGLVEIALRTSDALVLRGWFAPGPARDAVVLVHGLWANRAQLLPEASLLARRGHGVLLYDSRCSGESDGALATMGEREQRDLAAALDFLDGRPEVERGRVGLFGFSAGGSAAALASTDPRVASLALGPTWPTLEDELRDKLGGSRAGLWTAELLFRLAGLHVDAVRPIDVIERRRAGTLLLLGGSADRDTPLEQMARLAGAASGAELRVVPNARHASLALQSPELVDGWLGGFFDRTLGPTLGRTLERAPGTAPLPR